MRHNPLTDGSLPARTGLIFSLTFIAASLVISSLAAPWALLPWSGVLAVFVGLALHVFETPLARALTLGGLQALYLLTGAAAGQLSPGLGLVAGVFLFAMFGGRGMTDIRDFSYGLIKSRRTRHWEKERSEYETKAKPLAGSIPSPFSRTGSFARHVSVPAAP
jgi:hypothetical protein